MKQILLVFAVLAFTSSLFAQDEFTLVKEGEKAPDFTIALGSCSYISEEALDRPFSKMHETNGIPTVDLKVQFKKAARLGDILTKKLWVKNLGGASILCGFQFEDENGKTCLEGEVTLVNVAFAEDRNNIKAEPFKEEMKQKIEKFIIK